MQGGKRMSEQATVLIAEDDAGHFALVKKNLWRCCPVRDIFHFRDGEELMRYLMDPEAKFRIVSGRNYLLLLDLRLPRIDGTEVLERIKADPELCKIPVIVLTTSQDEADVNRCYELGCSAYVTKPLDYTAFMETVEALGAVLSLPEFAWPRIHSDQIRSRIE